MEMRKRTKWGDEKEDVSLLLHKQGCLIQILVKLPVEDLLRFKDVCESWSDLIQSPFFIDLHTPITLNSSSSSKFGSFIVQVYDRFFPPPNSSSYHHSLLMLSSQSDYKSSVSISGGGSGGGGGGVGDQEEEEEDEGPVVVVDDLGYNMDKKAIVGSCNGLVCLRDANFCISKPDQVYLWNPATQQTIKQLPKAITIPDGVFSLVGFGFDVETKDYKVVQFTGLKRRRIRRGSEFCFCQVQVYSSSTDSWRLLKGIPCLPGYPFDHADSVLYLNGTCFFLAHFFHTKQSPCLAKNNRFIISFDFTKEIITPIQLPDHHRDQKLCLCSWGDDNIALFTSPNPLDLFEDDAPIRKCQDFNIWVLKYERSSSGVMKKKKSWTNMYSFQIQVKSQYDEWYMPSGISNDGKFALLASEYDKKMNLYNFATKEVKRDFLSCRKVKTKAYAYKPTLVSVSFSQEEMVQQQQQQPIG